MRVVVVGGGILGAATARLVARARADAQVVLLEREADLATHQTARNSGVVHAGIYLTNALLPAGSVRSSTRCANLPTSLRAVERSQRATNCMGSPATRFERSTLGGHEVADDHP